MNMSNGAFATWYIIATRAFIANGYTANTCTCSVAVNMSPFTTNLCVTSMDVIVSGKTNDETVTSLVPFDVAEAPPGRGSVFTGVESFVNTDGVSKNNLKFGQIRGEKPPSFLYDYAINVKRFQIKVGNFNTRDIAVSYTHLTLPTICSV